MFWSETFGFYCDKCLLMKTVKKNYAFKVNDYNNVAISEDMFFSC